MENEKEGTRDGGEIKIVEMRWHLQFHVQFLVQFHVQFHVQLLRASPLSAVIQLDEVSCQVVFVGYL
jgi:hypothetical protein